MKVVLDTHCHTIASGHAFSTVKECAEEAARKGLKLISITDHAPKMPGSASALYFLNLKSLPKTLFGVELFTGVELNIMNDGGEIDLREGILKTLDFAIASLHLPCMPPGDYDYNTRAVTNAMKNPYVKIIGHLGDPRYPMDIDKVLDCAKKTGTVIEINEKSSDENSGVRTGGVTLVYQIAKECARKEIDIVLGSDSHFYQEIGRLDNAAAIALRAEVPERLILNTSLERFKQVMRSGKNV
jgi:putative hydrolase